MMNLHLNQGENSGCSLQENLFNNLHVDEWTLEYDCNSWQANILVT